MSRLGLGLAALGRPGYITLGHRADIGEDASVAALERRAHQMLDAAHDGGVRYVDAARSYGRAEAFLASWLAGRGLEPGSVAVASKWGYTYSAGWRRDADRHEVKELTVDVLTRQLGESLALLDGHLTLYQIHSATFESGVLEDATVLARLRELRASGIEVGLTVTGAEQAATVERALATDLFDAVQATWNLLERSAEAVLAAAHAAGLRVVVKEAVANGRLTARGDVPALAAAARELETTPDAVALALALAQPWADVVLSGAATVETLRSNLRALDVDVDDALRERLSPLTEEPSVYWSTRAALPWN